MHNHFHVKPNRCVVLCWGWGFDKNMKILKRPRRTFTVNGINIEDIQKSGSKKSIVKTPGRMSPVRKTGLKKKKAEPSVDKNGQMNSHAVM